MDKILRHCHCGNSSMNIIINTVIFYILWLAIYQDKLETIVEGIIKFGKNYASLESENFHKVMQV